MTDRSDPVSPELREVEQEVDSWYLRNPIFSRPFAEAAWFIMAVYEDILFLSLHRPKQINVHSSFALADYIIVHSQYPLAWAWKSCPQGGEPPSKHDEGGYENAFEATKLAEAYNVFDSAFTYASGGFIELELQGDLIQPIRSYYGDPRFDAYDQLIKPRAVFADSSEGDLPSLVSDRVQVSKDSFHYRVGTDFVERAMKILDPLTSIRYELPPDWDFGPFTLQHFRQVSSVLIALANIHFLARLHAARQGCEGLGLANCLIEFDRDRLQWRLVRSAGVSFEVAQELISLLTYGSHDIRRPDPALQPLIPINSDTLLLMPSIYMFGSVERNFTVLLNRIPQFQTEYSILVNSKEKEMRKRLKQSIALESLRYFEGNIPGGGDLPDIDLAIISESEKLVLLLELKWFIAPAEVREVVEKSAEVRKGVEQMELLLDFATEHEEAFSSAMGITTEYDVMGVVLSESSIGNESSQSPVVPVLNAEHFLHKLNTLQSLARTAKWITSRSFLPAEGEHFKVEDVTVQIGPWKLEWSGIETLVEDEYMR